MTKQMADAIHDQVGSLHAIHGLEMVAGYVTGTPDIQWTPTDFAGFIGIPKITIDQGNTSFGSPVSTAIVRDYEPNAWYTKAVVDTSNWNAERKTIYCDRFDLTQILNYGWRGDLWLAIPGWTLGEPLPNTPGCNIVAVQNQFDVQNAYDLSIVLDDSWPILSQLESDMPIMIAGGPAGAISLLDGGKMHRITDTTAPYAAAGIPLITVSASEYDALLADFPPGNPAVTVNTPAHSYSVVPVTA